MRSDFGLSKSMQDPCGEWVTGEWGWGCRRLLEEGRGEMKDLDQVGCSGGSDKWYDSEYILSLALAGFANG